jgi:hypothetical protein
MESKQFTAEIDDNNSNNKNSKSSICLASRSAFFFSTGTSVFFGHPTSLHAV